MGKGDQTRLQFFIQIKHHDISRTLSPWSKFAPKQIKEIRKEGNALFNDTLNAFYLRLYDIW